MPKSTKFLTQLNPQSDQDNELLEEGAAWLFDYHPWTEEQRLQGAPVREALKHAYMTIVRNVKSGPMRTRALNMITDCRMLANQAITFPEQ